MQLSPDFFSHRIWSEMCQTYAFYVLAAVYSLSPLGLSHDSYSRESCCNITAEPRMEFYRMYAYTLGCKSERRNGYLVEIQCLFFFVIVLKVQEEKEKKKKKEYRSNSSLKPRHLKPLFSIRFTNKIVATSTRNCEFQYQIDRFSPSHPMPIPPHPPTPQPKGCMQA